MAYHGEIQYAHRQTTTTLDWAPDVQLKAIDAVDPNGGRTWRLQAQPLRISEGCFVELRKDTDCEFKDAEGRLVGWDRFDAEHECDVGKLKVISIAKQDTEARGRIPWKNFANAWGFEGDLLSGSLSYVLVVSSKPLSRLGVAVIHSDYLSCPGTSQLAEVFELHLLICSCLARESGGSRRIGLGYLVFSLIVIECNLISAGNFGNQDTLITFGKA
jgi:hypothetical protein